MAAPAIEQTHALGHAGYTLWIFALPLLLSALIEAPLALWSDRVGRRGLLIGGTLGLSLALLLASLASAPWLFALALALAGAASGAACAAGQAELIASSTLGSARAMSRWTVFAALGDALVPFFVTLTAWLNYGYRGALCALGIAALLQALFYLRTRREESQPASAEESSEDVEVTYSSALRTLADRPKLVLFLLASSACCLLDEVVVAVVALRFRLDQGHSLSATAAGSTLIALGSVVGALIADYALTRTSMRRILLASALLCLCALGLLLYTSSLPASLVLLWLIGVSAAPHHPLMQAAAYEEAPGSPGLVNAALQLFVVVEIGAPMSVGIVAEVWGLSWALLVLAAQPLVIVFVARCMR